MNDFIEKLENQANNRKVWDWKFMDISCRMSESVREEVKEGSCAAELSIK